MSMRIARVLCLAALVAAALTLSSVEVPAGAATVQYTKAQMCAGVTAPAHLSDAQKAKFVAAARKAHLSSAAIKRVVYCGAENLVAVTKTSSTHVTTQPGDAAMSTASTTTGSKQPTTQTSVHRWCHTYTHQVSAQSWAGVTVYSFGYSFYACFKSYIDYTQSCARQYRITSTWSADRVTQSVFHNASRVAKISWRWRGLDDTGNWGPEVLGKYSRKLKRQGHFEQVVGVGPISQTVDDEYPNVDMHIYSTGKWAWWSRSG